MVRVIGAQITLVSTAMAASRVRTQIGRRRRWGQPEVGNRAPEPAPASPPRARRSSGAECLRGRRSVRPAGAGSQILGCDIAFIELLAAGQIDRLPRLLVGSPSTGPPSPTLSTALTRPVKEPASPPSPKAHPSPPRCASPKRSRRCALRRRSRRRAGAEIHDAARALAARGLYAEPTSAVAVAALDHFVSAGTITPDQTTVVVLTGSGLKSADKMATLFPDQAAPFTTPQEADDDG
jgi:hypothetical protein